MKELDIKAIKARLAAVSPASWKWRAFTNIGIRIADAKFIANAPTDIAELISAYQELQMAVHEDLVHLAHRCYDFDETTVRAEIERLATKYSKNPTFKDKK